MLCSTSRLPSSKSVFPSLDRRQPATLEKVRKFSIITNFVAAVKVREQFNAITAFLDMSSVYASDKKWQTAMRRKTFHTKRCHCKSLLCNRARFRKYCPGTLEENSSEKGLPTRLELGPTTDFMPGQSGEFKVSLHSVLCC